MTLSRKDFIRNSSVLMAGGGMLLTSTGRKNAPIEMPHFKDRFTIKNARLETGFIYENEEVVQTKTALFNIEVADGKVMALLPADGSVEGYDAEGLLMLPAFKEMHIHMDKTFYGLPWQAHLKKNRSVKDMIRYEQQVIPELLKTSTKRSESLIELLQSKGTCFARSHVNIEPTSKLDSLVHLQRALENKKDSFSAELVIFPQHGLFYTDSVALMKEAAKMNIDYIGGLDPYSIDGSIERSMDFVVQLALDHEKGIDIHLHEQGASGIKTISYLIDRVNENPQLKGKTFVSHAFALAGLKGKALQQMAESLANAKVGIISTIPFGRTIMPIPTLYKHGVDVRAGNDCIIDHWSTFGSGSVLQKANLMAQLYGYTTEFELSRSLKLATHNVLPLNDQGMQTWPKSGDQASFVLIDAACSAQAVSRISPVRSLVHKGQVVF